MKPKNKNKNKKNSKPLWKMIKKISPRKTKHNGNKKRKETNGFKYSKKKQKKL